MNYIIKETIVSRGSVQTKYIDITQQDLDECHQDIEDWCNEIVEVYEDDNGDAISLTIEYSEDEGKTWIMNCENYLLI